jgi:hypothetical protein
VDPITADQFTARLGAICARGSQSGLPGKEADRLVVLKSVIMTMEPGRTYTAVEMTEAMKRWMATVGPGLGTDHATLRRELVDGRLLARDAGGTSYWIPSPGPRDGEFAPEVSALDPVAIVEQARARIEQKKRERGL